MNQLVFRRLAADADNEYGMINGTILRAHQHRAGAPKTLARTRRNVLAAIHLATAVIWLNREHAVVKRRRRGTRGGRGAGVGGRRSTSVLDRPPSGLFGLA